MGHGNRFSRGILATVGLGIALLCTGCSDRLRLVPGDDPEFPRLEDADGIVSINDRCPVRKKPLNPKMAPIYVNGRPLGFC